MKLFRRNKQTVNMPPEVAEYYQAERRDRRGVTLLLTVLALCVTVAIIVGLFLAGRWIYRTVQGDSQDNTAQTSETQTNGNQGSSDNSGGSNSSDSSSNSSNGNSGDNQASNDQNIAEDDSASDNSGNSSGSGSSTDDPTAADGNASTTQDSGSGAAGSADNLTNTGPGETALAVFAGGSAVGYALYRRRLLRAGE